MIDHHDYEVRFADLDFAQMKSLRHLHHLHHLRHQSLRHQRSIHFHHRGRTAGNGASNVCLGSPSASVMLRRDGGLAYGGLEAEPGADTELVYDKFADNSRYIAR